MGVRIISYVTMGQRCSLSNKTNRNDVTVQIDNNLKRIFAEDAEQELPPRLLDLMQQLDQIDAAASRNTADSSDDEGLSS